MIDPLQTSRLLGARQQQAADTLVVPPDSLADTLSLGERLRADSTIFKITNPSDTFRMVLESLRENLLDPVIWIGVLGVIIQILVICFLAFLLIRLVDRITDRWTKKVEELPALHPRRQRAFTISNLISSSARYIVWPIAVIMALDQINIDVGALIATAGIAGLAIGFGAQTFVKDVISGIFLLFDDTIHVGDLVRIGQDTGTVEYIGIRLIKIRKFDGEMLMVPSGDLRMFGNKSITFVRLIVNVGLSYEQDIERILPVMERVAKQWAAEHKEILMEEQPTVHALLDFAESSVTARIVMMVLPGEQFQAERDLRILLKREFDRLGIEIPFPRRTLYLRREPELPPHTIPDLPPDDHPGDDAPDEPLPS